MRFYQRSLAEITTNAFLLVGGDKILGNLADHKRFKLCTTGFRRVVKLLVHCIVELGFQIHVCIVVDLAGFEELLQALATRQLLTRFLLIVCLEKLRPFLFAEGDLR